MKAWKVSIAHRLFAAVLVAFLAVETSGLLLVRWSFSSGTASRADVERVGALALALGAQWSRLPAEPSARSRWLGEQLTRTQAVSPALAERLGLLDAEGQVLAGVTPSRALVALASIDTVEFAVLVDGQRVGTLVLSRAENPEDDLTVAFLLSHQRNLGILAALSLALSALAAAVLAAGFRRPIDTLVKAANQLSRGAFKTRIASQRTDELGVLARTFDQLAAKLEDAEQARAQWVATTSHELRTPLSVLRAQVEAMQDGVRTATPENFEVMTRQLASLAALVGELAELAKADLGQLQFSFGAVDAWQVVAEVAEDFAQKFAEAGLSSQLGTAPARAEVWADRDRLRQVISNLFENCVRYTDRGGRLEVGAVVSGARWRLTIDDSAPGVSDAALKQLGERFFRADASRRRHTGGAGLGLALSRELISAQGGELTFDHSPLGGVRVTVELALR